MRRNNVVAAKFPCLARPLERRLCLDFVSRNCSFVARFRICEQFPCCFDCGHRNADFHPHSFSSACQMLETLSTVFSTAPLC